MRRLSPILGEKFSWRKTSNLSQHPGLTGFRLEVFGSLEIDYCLLRTG